MVSKTYLPHAVSGCPLCEGENIPRDTLLSHVLKTHSGIRVSGMRVCVCVCVCMCVFVREKKEVCECLYACCRLVLSECEGHFSLSHALGF